MASRRPTTIVSLADEADAQGVLQHRAFERALILGPAVVAPIEKVSFINGSFSGDPESLFIEVPEGQRVQGVIPLRDVSFTECRFENIAIIGTADSLAQFRAEMQPPDASSQHPPQVSPLHPVE